jgi:hypothetical protein
MKTASSALLGLLGVLVTCVPVPGQGPCPSPGSPVSTWVEAPPCRLPSASPDGCHWVRGCFPRGGCPDDYCPNPYPRQCWPPYPPFYKCVVAGNCGHPPCVGVGNEKLTWWWIPTPRALRDALWLQP